MILLMVTTFREEQKKFLGSKEKFGPTTLLSGNILVRPPYQFHYQQDMFKIGVYWKSDF